MHSIWKDIITAFLMGAVLPGFLLNAAALVFVDEPSERPAQETVEVETAPREIHPMRARQKDGKLKVMDLEEYLVGVVLGEMPVSFEEEALKAQAVVARTYTRKAYETGGKHQDGSVCQDASCCQAYISEEDYLQRGGSGEDLEKVRRAVEATAGLVLTYEGELIEATYFSCSGGSTEDAAAVWGTDFPYLQAVESPGEEQAAHYTDTVSFTPQSFQAALGQPLSGTPEGWFGEFSYTDGGGVAELKIGGKDYTGTQLRRLLRLRSTAFTIRAGEETIEITTKGFGHRVGMSQYGADAMAVDGSSFGQILAHYYPGTILQSLDRFAS